jgi:hypothetical protein
MKNINWLDYEKSFKALGFTDEQVSIMVESVQNISQHNEMSATVKLDEILGEMKKYSSLEDETYVVKQKVNEAEEDLEDDNEEVAPESEEPTDDTEEVAPESEEPTDDTEEVAPESETPEEMPTDEFEDDLGDEIQADDEIESEDETDEVEPESETEESEDDDMEDETENELEDETEYDEENESEDYDELNANNIEYSKAFIQAIEDRAWARGYKMGFQDKESLGSIMAENKQLIEDVKKVLMNESKSVKSDNKLTKLVEQKNLILGKTSKSDSQVAKEILDEAVKPQNKKTELFGKNPTPKSDKKVETKVTTPKVEPKVATPKSDKKVITENVEEKLNKKVKVSVKEELSARDNIFAKLYEEIEVPSMPSANANSYERMNEMKQIQQDKKEHLIENFLVGLTDIRKAELKPLLSEMAKNTDTVEKFNQMLSLIPKSVSKTTNTSVNESIEKSKSIYNSNSMENYINDVTMKYFKMFN